MTGLKCRLRIVTDLNTSARKSSYFQPNGSIGSQLSMWVSTLLIAGFLLVTLVFSASEKALAQPEELKLPPRQHLDNESSSSRTPDGASQSIDSGVGHGTDIDERVRRINSLNQQAEDLGRKLHALQQSLPGAEGPGDGRMHRADALNPRSTDLEEESHASLPNIPKDKQKRVELRFGGSLCPSCLILFERKLYDTGAVVSVEMTLAKKRPGQLAKLAIATVDYDPTRINKAELIEMVKRNDFQFMEATDKEVQ